MSRSEAAWLLFISFSMVGLGLGILLGQPVKDTSSQPEWYRVKMRWGIGLIVSAFSIFIMLSLMIAFFDDDSTTEIGFTERMIISIPTVVALIAGISVFVWAIYDRSRYSNDELAIERTLKVEESRRNIESGATREHNLKVLIAGQAHELVKMQETEIGRENQRVFARWQQTRRMMDNAMQSLTLVTEELRKNPAFADVASQFLAVHEEMKAAYPAIEIDEAAAQDNLEEALLAMYKKRYGL